MRLLRGPLRFVCARVVHVLLQCRACPRFVFAIGPPQCSHVRPAFVSSSAALFSAVRSAIWQALLQNFACGRRWKTAPQCWHR